LEKVIEGKGFAPVPAAYPVIFEPDEAYVQLMVEGMLDVKLTD
jgi:hypothetical protein